MSNYPAVIDAPSGPVTVPVREFEWRVARLRAAMEREGLDDLLVYGWPWRSENVRYLTGANTTGGVTLLRVTIEGDMRVLVSSQADHAAVLRAGLVTDVSSGLRHGADGLASFLAQITPGRRIGVTHLELLPAALSRLIREALPAADIVSATALADSLRMVKSPWEHANLIEAMTIADRGWEAMLADLRPGVREFEIVASAERELKRLGAEDNFMLIAFGNTEVRGMHPPEDRPIAEGELMRTEMTPQFGGYYGQICRTAVLGTPTDEQADAYDAFIGALNAGIAAVRPGATSHDIALAENDVLRSRGLGEYCTTRYMRVRGHGVGLHVDEKPGLQEGDPTVIPEGATLVIHPNTYHPVGYIVVGDSVIVTASGSTRLSNVAPTIPSVVVVGS